MILQAMERIWIMNFTPRKFKMEPPNVKVENL